MSRTDVRQIENLSGWLTTVTSRICLDLLRARAARREDAETLATGERVDPTPGPEAEALMTESVGLAMATVLERLPPAERVAFVLHDVFGVAFEDIATIVERSPSAARQLASRGRRRVQATPDEIRTEDTARHRPVVEAFFKASRAGDLRALVAVLDPNVTLRADAAALAMGARNGWLTSDLQGADSVAEQFAGQASGAQLALISGAPGAYWAPRDTIVGVFLFSVVDDVIQDIQIVADRSAIAAMEIKRLETVSTR